MYLNYPMTSKTFLKKYRFELLLVFFLLFREIRYIVSLIIKKFREIRYNIS